MTDDEIRASLTKSAKELAKDLEPEQRPGFISDYVDILFRCNQKIAIILDAFQIDSSGIVSAHLPHRPGIVKTIIDTHAGEVKSLIQIFLPMITKVGDAATRTLMIKAVQNGFRACVSAVDEMADKNEARAKVQLT